VLEACSVTAGCEDGQRTWGVALGGFGGFFGAEFDLAYTKAFFGEIVVIPPATGPTSFRLSGNLLGRGS
jgi:hypothetical protein